MCRGVTQTISDFQFFQFLFVVGVRACVSGAGGSSLRVSAGCQGDRRAHRGVHWLKLGAVISVIMRWVMLGWR